MSFIPDSISQQLCCCIAGKMSVFLHFCLPTVIHPSEIMKLSKDAGGIVYTEGKFAKEQEHGFDTDMSVLAGNVV